MSEKNAVILSRFRFVNTAVSLMSDIFRLVFPNKIYFI